MKQTDMKKNNGYYCWIIAVTSAISFMVYAGITNNTTSLYLIPVSQTLRVNRTVVSLTNSLRSVGGVCSNLIFGFAYYKFGFRKLASFGLLMSGVSFLGMALSQTVFAYAICSFLLGFSGGFCATGAVANLLNDWFVKYRGLILGVVTSFSGLGGSFFSIVLSSIMEKSGWRASHVFSAVLMGIAAISVIALIRSKPEDMGCEAFGKYYIETQKIKTKTTDFPGPSLFELTRTPAFYLAMVFALLSAACAYASMHILVAHLQDRGISAMDAAKVQSILFVVLAVSKILTGFLSDMIGAKQVTIGAVLCCGIAAWLLSEIDGISEAVFPTVLLGIGLPITTILQQISTVDLFGQRSAGSMVGFLLAMTMVASMIIDLFMNAVYVSSGSYCPALKVILAVSILTTILYLMICQMTKKFRER